MLKYTISVLGLQDFCLTIVLFYPESEQILTHATSGKQELSVTRSTLRCVSLGPSVKPATRKFSMRVHDRVHDVGIQQFQIVIVRKWFCHP